MENTAEISQTAPARQPQIPNELEQMGEVASQIEEAIKQLEQRLDPVLRREPTAIIDDSAKDAEALVPHAENLRVLRRKLDQIFRSVVDLTARLEV